LRLSLIALSNLAFRTVLEALGPEGILINVARGSIVDEESLIHLLKEGKLGGAGLDVFANEPNLTEELKSLSNLVLQPHHGSGLRGTLYRLRRAMCAHPPSLPYAVAACAEPLAVTLHAVARAGAILSRRALITGAGPSGCWPFRRLGLRALPKSS
jgi:hypothetical protein